MTLTQSSSDANNGSRQRFELELLLQRAVPNPDQLNGCKDLLQNAVDGVSADGWKHLQSVPINSDSDHLDIAIPSHWRDEDWQRLIEQLPTQNRTIRLHPALEVDLQAALHNKEATSVTTEHNTASQEPSIAVVISEQLSPPRDTAESTNATDSIDSFLGGFDTESVFDADPDEKSSLANDAEASPVVALVYRILLQGLTSRTLVQEGVLLSTSLIRQKVLPDMAQSMLAIGEETGEMDKMLIKVADFYEDEVEARVKALTSMLEPAMIVVVGGIVASILLAMYVSMFTIFDQIQ